MSAPSLRGHGSVPRGIVTSLCGGVGRSRSLPWAFSLLSDGLVSVSAYTECKELPWLGEQLGKWAPSRSQPGLASLVESAELRPLLQDDGRSGVWFQCPQPFSTLSQGLVL